MWGFCQWIFFIASFVWEVIVLIFFQGTKSRLRSCGAGCCFGAFTLLPCEWGGCHLFTAVLGSGFFIECLVWFGSVHETTFVVPTRKEPVCEKPVKRAGREVWNSVYNTMYDQGSRGNRISSEVFCHKLHVSASLQPRAVVTEGLEDCRCGEDIGVKNATISK